ncbi:MAG: YidC/Oxa1 family insertase periplasmic-domain containing protein, partial [Gammaproteobacteria bacterium]|nr:YidC/Oxa1 family insertase periplasmic-domain containing protein [Gammaproteobacteria bacterium]
AENDSGADAVLAETEPQPNVEAVAAPEQERAPAELQRLTIGSLDPASGYPGLITCISHGAAVERVEMSDPKYRDLEDKSAYIGHLALDTAPQMQGVRVNVVGDGTPAAKATATSGVSGGLRVGDIITKVGGEPVSTPAAFHQLREKYKFGETIELAVTRITQASGKQSLSFTIQSIQRPLEVIRPEPSQPDEENPQHQLSYLLSLRQIGHRRTEFDQDELPELPSLRDGIWYSNVVEVDGITKIEFRFPLGRADLEIIGVAGSIEIVKRFWFEPAADVDESSGQSSRNYHFDFEIELVNKGQNPIELAYRLDGPTGLPLEGWWYSYKTHPKKWGSAGVRDVVWRAQGDKHQMFTNASIRKEAKDKDNPEKDLLPDQGNKLLQYVGVDAQYFNSTLLADPLQVAGTPPYRFERVVARLVAPVDALRATRTDITFRLDSSVQQVHPGDPFRQHFQIFAGPKKTSVLTAYDLEECIVYGWFKWPAQLMGKLLHFFYGIVGSYGIAIILLTVVVRACMFPIGRQQAMNARKMQELTPEIKKIKEKFPKDTQKQTAAQQELFRKHKYNPVAGCLPMFLQLPIFIGLYRALSVDIELRQTPLIPGVDWCSNLAAPDMLYRWDSFLPQMLAGYTGWLGPYLNLLPLISTGLFLVHQHMFTPPPTDEQQEMQQRVMKFMMIIMVVIFFKVPAGLCLYFITSSLWALAERKMLPNKPTAPEQTPVSLASKTATAGGSNSSNGSAAAKKKSRRKKNRK